MDFGRRNSSCHILSEGFVLWEVTGEESEVPICLEGMGFDMFVHVLMLEGEMKLGWGGQALSIDEGMYRQFDRKFLVGSAGYVP